MKSEKGNFLLKFLIIIILIGLAGILGYLVYNTFLCPEELVVDNPVVSTQMGQVDTNTQIKEPNLQTINKIENTIENSSPIYEPGLNITNNDSNVAEVSELISNSYYYNQLNSTGKAIYDSLKANKEKLRKGNHKIDYGTRFNQLLHSENGEKELNEAFQSAWNAFSYDEPDLFYIDINKITLVKEYRSIGSITTYYVSIDSGSNPNYFKDSFKEETQVVQAESYLQNIAKQVIEQTKDDNAQEKAKKIHDWLVASIEYDATGKAENEYHIYGALHDGKAVCEGYARAYKYLMEKVGVPCVLVSGTATNSEGKTESHAWNYVQIDNEWYAVDVTWDDPIIRGDGEPGEEIRYRYFLKGSQTFFANHKEDGAMSDNSMEFKYPTLSVTDHR